MCRIFQHRYSVLLCWVIFEPLTRIDELSSKGNGLEMVASLPIPHKSLQSRNTSRYGTRTIKLIGSSTKSVHESADTRLPLTSPLYSFYPMRTGAQGTSPHPVDGPLSRSSARCRIVVYGEHRCTLYGVLRTLVVIVLRAPYGVRTAHSFGYQCTSKNPVDSPRVIQHARSCSQPVLNLSWHARRTSTLLIRRVIPYRVILDLS